MKKQKILNLISNLESELVELKDQYPIAEELLLCIPSLKRGCYRAQ